MKHKFLLITASLIMLTGAVKAQVTKTTTADYPFELTTDASNPILYYIYNGRDGAGGADLKYVLANEIPWGDTVHKLQIVRKDPRIFPNQLWYFMKAEGGLMIISAEDNRMVTVANTADAPKCTLMQTAEERTNNFYLWTLDLTDGCYAFRTSDGKTFLSHNGNWTTAGPQMGLYNADGSKDEGSRMFFEALPREEYPTGLKSVVLTQQEEVYTLTGQCIQRIVAPGIYIIGGKKVIVH